MFKRGYCEHYSRQRLRLLYWENVYSESLLIQNIVEHEDKNVSVVVILPLEYVISNSIS